MPSAGPVKPEASHLLSLFAKRMSSSPRPDDLSHYKPQQSDIIIVTYPKAGTTLLRNMAYQVAVATGGAPSFDPDGTNFEDLAQVAPWLEFGPQFGVLECDTSPRVFKSHLRASAFDKSKSKFVFCIRNPLDFPASALDFLFEPMLGRTVTDKQMKQQILDGFARATLLGMTPSQKTVPEEKKSPGGKPVVPGSWFEYLREWVGEKHENVLVLFYEEVKDDYAGASKKIAKFMGRELSDEKADIVAQRCDRKAMAADDRFASPITKKGMGLPLEIDIRSVKLEKREGFKSLRVSEDIVNTFNGMMLKEFGVRNYEEFCKMMKKIHQC